jgi:hypothetical protein
VSRQLRLSVLIESKKMHATTLHIVAAIANPIRWESRVRLARNAISDWLTEPNVHVTLVEAAYGARSFELDDLGECPASAPLRQI